MVYIQFAFVWCIFLILMVNYIDDIVLGLEKAFKCNFLDNNL